MAADHVALTALAGKKRQSDGLLPAEKRRLCLYEEAFARLRPPKCEVQDLVCHLGDNPATGWSTWSARSMALPTIQRSGSLYFAVGLGRPMTLAEMYLAMGFPTMAVALEASHLTRLYPVALHGMSWFDQRRALGNSMCVPNVGVVMGSMLLCSRRKKLPAKLEDLMSRV